MVMVIITCFYFCSVMVLRNDFRIGHLFPVCYCRVQLPIEQDVEITFFFDIESVKGFDAIFTRNLYFKFVWIVIVTATVFYYAVSACPRMMLGYDWGICSLDVFISWCIHIDARVTHLLTCSLGWCAHLVDVLTWLMCSHYRWYVHLVDVIILLMFWIG